MKGAARLNDQPSGPVGRDNIFWALVKIAERVKGKPLTRRQTTSARGPKTEAPPQMHGLEVEAVLLLLDRLRCTERLRQTFQVLWPDLDQTVARSIYIGDQKEGKRNDQR